MINKLFASRFARFAAVGGSATALQYVLLVAFVEWQLMAKVSASAISFALSALVNYWLNYRFTFASNKRHAETLPKFAVTASIGLAVNTFSFWLLLLALSHYLVAQVSATAVTLVSNFLLHKYWIYRSQHDDNNTRSGAIPSDSRSLLQRRRSLRQDSE